MADLKMMDALSAYNKVAKLQPAPPSEDSSSASGSDFTSMIQEALTSTVDDIKTAETLSSSGNEKVSLEDLAIAVANAELSLKTVVAIRDKLISAFQDILRMPI